MGITNDTIRILFVDDDPAFAEIAADVLESENKRITVESTTSAAEGLNRVDDHAFDCIVSDYKMPDQTGIEFLKTIRERYPDLPFILFTGKGSEAVASDAISGGVTDYLQKSGSTKQYSLLANRIVAAVDQTQTQRRSARLEYSSDIDRDVTEYDANMTDYSPETVLRVDQVLNTLSHSIRREIVYYFENQIEEANASLDELATYLARRLPDETREDLLIKLPQTHLSKLQSDGWLEYDHRSGHIAYYGCTDAKRILRGVLQNMIHGTGDISNTKERS